MTMEAESPYILAQFHGQKPPAPAWFEAALANAPERGFFTSDGAQIELLTWGERGRPGLLLLAGNAAHADWWRFIAPFFSHDWRVATLSWSGMGRSDHREAGYTLDIFAREAQEVIAAAGLDDAGPPVVVGHSLGGAIGLHAAAAGARFRGLVLIDSPVNMDPERMKDVRARAPKARETHRPFASFDEALAKFRLSPPQPCINPFIADYIARHSMIEKDGAFYWRFDPRRVTIPTDRKEPDFGALGCPMAYMYGDRSALLNADTVARAKAVLPAGTPILAIPDAAHHVPMDQPLALVAALRGLLAVWLK